MSARTATCAASTLPSSDSMRARISSLCMPAPFVGLVGGTSIVQRKRVGAYQALAATENVAVEVQDA